MGQLAEDILATLFGLPAPAVYLAVGIACFAEAPLFLGLVTPGEMAVVAGGVLATRDQVAVAGVAAAAAAGTIVGNGVGFWLGRAWGARLAGWGPVRKLLGGALEASRSYFGRRGDWAVVLGRFASYVRIFVPFLAGSSQMSYRRFAALDVPAALAWSAAWAIVGYAVGESWDVLLELSGPASFLILFLVLLALFTRWAAVRIARGEETVQSLARRALGTGLVAWARSGSRAVGGWIRRRFDPRLARGLNLTLGFLAVVLGVGGVGLVLDNAAAGQGLARLDFPVLEWMSATRTEAAVRVARTGLWLFHWPGLLLPGLLTAGLLWWRIDGRAALRAALGILGAGVGAHLLDHFALEGVVPNAEFPSVPVAVAAALLVHTTAAAGRHLAWGRAVAAGATGFFLACTVALGTLVAGWAAPSGIVLGFALGLGWSAALEVQAKVV